MNKNTNISHFVIDFIYAENDLYIVDAIQILLICRYKNKRRQKRLLPPRRSFVRSLNPGTKKPKVYYKTSRTFQ